MLLINKPKTSCAKAILLLTLVIASQTVCSQVKVVSTSNQPRTNVATPLTDSELQQHSPMVALRWSLIPGAGQIYNHQAWKIPIIYTAFAVTGYVAYRHYNSMVTFRDEYLYRINNGVPNLQAYANYGTSNIYNLYQSYSRYFQLSIIVGVGFYALNLLDAYVFGHLFDFQLDESLALRASPTLLPCGDVASPALSLNLTF